MKFLQVLVLIIGFAVLANAQNVSQRGDKSTLSGTVFDQHGAVISQTKVTFTDNSGKVFAIFTNEDGVYEIELIEGKYTIEFYKAYFKPYKIENYNLAFKTKMQFDVVLEVKPCPEINCDWIEADPVQTNKKP